MDEVDRSNNHIFLDLEELEKILKQLALIQQFKLRYTYGNNSTGNIM